MEGSFDQRRNVGAHRANAGESLSIPATKPQDDPDDLTGDDLVDLVMGAPSASLESNSRTFPRRLKQPLLAAQRGRCSHPFCNAKVHWLHADHKHPYSKGGPTHLHNAQLLCPMHNGLKGDRIVEQLPLPGTTPRRE